jgi:hypothetical protein
MLVPQDAQELERAIEAGELEETPSFDAKECLPARKRNSDLAIDVAAMSTEGGVLLFGVGEDEQGRLTRRTPIDLGGAAERIGQIVATSISEVPHIQVKEHPIADGEIGYLSVLVPQSPRAPHQVTVGDDRRFYGRGAKGNRRLGEAEVARLYQRRLEWEQDREELLVDAVSQSRFQPHRDLSYLHGFTRPVAPERSIWERAVAAAGGRQQLHDALRAASDQAVARSPLSSRIAPNWRRQGSDEWLFSTLSDVDPDDEGVVDRAIDIRVNVDGRGHLFVGRAGARANGGMIVIIEPVIAGSLASFLAVMGKLYELGGYNGHIDLGIAVTGIREGVSSTSSGWSHAYGGSEPYRADSYTRTIRSNASALLEPRNSAASVLRDLFEATSGRDDYDPFAE